MIKLPHCNSKRIKVLSILLLAFVLLTAALSGCHSPGQGSDKDSSSSNHEVPAETEDADALSDAQEKTDLSDAKSSGSQEDEILEADPAPQPQPQPQPQQKAPTAEDVPQQEPQAETPQVTGNGHIVAIDAGHQAHGNSAQEPIGPGASETKAKVASGTSGSVSGLQEYELTLQVSLKLRDELESRGYQVVMIRETNDVDISNAERAEIANTSGAEIFLRIHANGSDDSSVKGALTMAPTSGNPYVSNIAAESQTLANTILDTYCAATGFKKRTVMEVDNMSGINWCTIPVTIVEMGFMSNPEDDARMADEAMQYQMASGIADGVDQYFGQ